MGEKRTVDGQAFVRGLLAKNWVIVGKDSTGKTIMEKIEVKPKVRVVEKTVAEAQKKK